MTWVPDIPRPDESRWAESASETVREDLSVAILQIHEKRLAKLFSNFTPLAMKWMNEASEAMVPCCMNA